MNRFEIRDILNAHKEHYRVLPTLACNDLNAIIKAVDKEEQDSIDALIEETAKKLVKAPVKAAKPVKEPKKRVVGKGTKKTAKKPARPRR